MDCSIDEADCKALFYKLPPENIVQLKNILETYDGLAGELRTLDAGKGEVVVLALEDTKELILKIINSIADDLGLRPIPPPKDSLDGDWLLVKASDS